MLRREHGDLRPHGFDCRDPLGDVEGPWIWRKLRRVLVACLRARICGDGEVDERGHVPVEQLELVGRGEYGCCCIHSSMRRN